MSHAPASSPPTTIALSGVQGAIAASWAFGRGNHASPW